MGKIISPIKRYHKSKDCRLPRRRIERGNTPKGRGKKEISIQGKGRNRDQGMQSRDVPRK